MKDVAKHARVSVSTVSHVLNDSGPVAPERRERVLDAVRVLEYPEHCREAGLRVPEEVSVVDFDDLPVSALLTPRLTTVRQPAHDMGFRAASALFDLLEKGESGAIGELPAVVQVRESVCPPAVDG
ncbi:hypothetical protein GCM10017577_74750 [Pseudonocardia halophobica]|uniref:HTH lacI-type domain-containing protein n=2 Tax=Pseudonocardia halophobica TaxID=29401 RepID=A0A9W6P1Y0_9PSEU|nr:hypothetical protein GCM10017577_74750 [Pseudonocardia halophobica]